MQFDNRSIFVMLARGYDPTSPRAVQGFSSLHPIMRFKGWFDRRLERRIRVSMPAVVSLNGVDQSVEVSDISHSGIGLCKTSGLRTGDHVTISIADEGVRHGTVIWTKQDWAGVSLDD